MASREIEIKIKLSELLPEFLNLMTDMVDFLSTHEFSPIAMPAVDELLNRAKKLASIE